MDTLIGLIFFGFIIVRVIKKSKGKTAEVEKRQQLNRSQQYVDQSASGSSRKKAAQKPVKKSRTTEDLRKTDSLRDVEDLRDTSSLRKMSDHECDVHGQAHVELDHTNHVDPIDVDSSELMDKVYDAMVCGPQVQLPSDRDFVAEGMDMINSFSA